METGITKFEAQKVRDEVVLYMEKMQKSSFVALPQNYKESAFFAIEKLASLQDIEKVPAIEITKALIKTFANKLDYQMNHCYFFVQNDKNSVTGKSLRYGWQYQGLIHVAKLTCDVQDVTPVLVHDNDTFIARYESGALIIESHIPTFEGAIKGGYVVINFDASRKIVKYYTKAELDKRRSKSMASTGKFWDWEREMYEKTLINAALKRLIETSGATDSEALYDEPEEPRTIKAEIVPQDEPKPTTKKIDLNNV